MGNSRSSHQLQPDDLHIIHSETGFTHSQVERLYSRYRYCVTILHSFSAVQKTGVPHSQIERLYSRYCGIILHSFSPLQEAGFTLSQCEWLYYDPCTFRTFYDQETGFIQILFARSLRIGSRLYKSFRIRILFRSSYSSFLDSAISFEFDIFPWFSLFRLKCTFNC